MPIASIYSPEGARPVCGIKIDTLTPTMARLKVIRVIRVIKVIRVIRVMSEIEKSGDVIVPFVLLRY